MSKKSVVVGLPIVPYNQNKHSDICQYLDYVQDFLADIYKADEEETLDSPSNHTDALAEVHRRERILKGVELPLGGDLLGRERISGAKKTRLGCDYPTERFGNIVENVAQWHTKQSFLGVRYVLFFTCNS